VSGRQAEETRLLDLGSGTGRFLAPLRLCFDAEVIGVDPSWNMSSVAALSGSAREFFLLGRAEQIPLQSQSVDLVFMSVVWHLLSDKGQACQEIHRVLQEGGYFCLRTPTPTRSILKHISSSFRRLTKSIVRECLAGRRFVGSFLMEI
jgi:ubiquinone/menaquinone biosynthesis C-methylase UbiE